MKKQTNKKGKAVALSLAMATALLSPAMLTAQELLGRHGGLFGEAASEPSNSLMDRHRGTVGVYFTGQGFGATGANITGQTFSTPLGSGLLVMLAAGASYATVKSRKKQNRKEK